MISREENPDTVVRLNLDNYIDSMLDRCNELDAGFEEEDYNDEADQAEQGIN